MSDFSDYIQALQQLRHTGVPETSAYGPLQNLLNAAGADLKPIVQCVLHPKNAGAGIPDGGFFTRDQLKNDADDPFAAQPPARGVLEVKALDADLQKLAAGAQVEKYRAQYGQVLVTNLREFALRGSDDAGNIATLEEYSLGETEAEFWENVADLREFEKQHAERLMEYLKRVLLHAAPLDNPEDVARFLASYARDARARLETPSKMRRSRP